MFLVGTIESIKDVTVSTPNLNTWVRDKKSTAIFLDKIEERLQLDIWF